METFNYNRWIFIQTKPNKVAIDCGTSEIMEISVSGTGTLNKPEQCTAYTNNLKLLSTKNVVIGSVDYIYIVVC